MYVSRKNKPKNNRNRLSFGLFRFKPKKKFDCFEDTLVCSNFVQCIFSGLLLVCFQRRWEHVGITICENPPAEAVLVMAAEVAALPHSLAVADICGTAWVHPRVFFLE
jgi:hypothetical protein